MHIACLVNVSIDNKVCHMYAKRTELTRGDLTQRT